MGRLNAVARLTRSYDGHLDRAAGLAGAPFLGLELPALRRRADAYFRDMTARDGARHDPFRYPYLDLAECEADAADGLSRKPGRRD